MVFLISWILKAYLTLTTECHIFFRLGSALVIYNQFADPHHFYAHADPDSACHFDADPDPTFHFFYADPDPDADPSFQIKAQNPESAQIGSFSIHFSLSSAN